MWVPVRRPGQPEDTALLTAAARLFVRGRAGGLGARCSAQASGGGWTCRPTRSSGSGTGRARRRAPAAVPVAGADGAEAGFWAAVEQADVDAVAGALQVPGDAPLREVLPVLSRWRRRRREQAVLDGWRYRVSWQPVADPEPGTLSGRWLLVVPSGLAGAGLAGVVAPGCWLTAARRWSPCRWIRRGWDREVLAAQLGQGLADAQDAGIAGVVSLLALDGRGR